MAEVQGKKLGKMLPFQVKVHGRTGSTKLVCGKLLITTPTQTWQAQSLYSLASAPRHSTPSESGPIQMVAMGLGPGT